MTREIEIRLIGHPSADGELLAADALGIIGSFKDIAYRLTRSVAERSGLGRTDAVLEKLATVRVALREGSTRVVFVVGDPDAILDPVARPVDEAFWSIVEGLGANARPPDMSDTVADSVDKLIVALTRAAPEAEISVPGHGPRTLRTDALSRDPWQRNQAEGAGEVSIHGVLEMVDLRSARFRLRDAAGNAVDLLEVVDADAAAHLVGERVVATGILAVGQGTQHHRMEAPEIARETSVENRLGLPTSVNIEELAEQARTTPAPAPLDISDEELDDFLAEIRA